MLFLGILPSMDDLKVGFLSGFRILLFSITRIIYEFLMQLYNLFKLLCNAQVLDDTIIGELSKRIGLILGLVMFFYIMFDFIQILIDPDRINDKDKGAVAIIKKFVIVIVLLGSGNFIFSYLYTFQTAILVGDDDSPSIIEKLILPNAVNSGDFGAVLAANYMTEFYKMTDDPDAEGKTNYEECLENVENFPNQIVSAHSLMSGEYCLTTTYKVDKESRFFVDFNFLMAIGIGVFSCWMIFMYCISVGMRVFQLAVLQIISPAAFVSYLSPKKDGMFTKFWKIYFATYIDVFIRIAIINFTVLLAGMVLDNGGSSVFWNSMGGAENMDGGTKFWLTVLMVLALLSFAKKAPDLIKKFIPESDSGLSFGVGTKDRAGLGMIGGTLAGAATGLVGGAVGGAMSGKGIFGSIAGAAGGAITGTAGGIGRGFFAGAKGKDLRDSITNANKNQATANLNKAQLRASGVTRAEQMGDAFRSRFGMMSGYEAEDKALTMSSNVKTLLEGEDPIKHLREAREAYRSSGGTDSSVYMKFDAVEKKVLAQEYSWAYTTDDGNKKAQIHVDEIKDSSGNTIMNGYTDEFSSNRAIYNSIHDNEKRARQKLDSYNGVIYQFDQNGQLSNNNYNNPRSTGSATSYKADNNALKTAKANRRNKGK